MRLLSLCGLRVALELPTHDPCDRRGRGPYLIKPAGAILDLDDVDIPLWEALARDVDVPDVVDRGVDVLIQMKLAHADLLQRGQEAGTTG